MELTTVLLGVPGVQFVLSEKLCQDPVESFFGKKEAEGSRGLLEEDAITPLWNSFV